MKAPRIRLFLSLLLFSLYFLCLWGGQFSAALAARQLSRLNGFLVPLYLCLTARGAVWFLILRRMELIRAYTLTSINYLLIPLLAPLLLGDQPGWPKLAGGIVIAAGIVLYGWGEQQRRSA